MELKKIVAHQSDIICGIGAVLMACHLHDLPGCQIFIDILGRRCRSRSSFLQLANFIRFDAITFALQGS